jgi:uncharacterized protein
MAPWTAVGYVSFGFAVGVYGTLIGAGGGFVIVPFLLLVRHARPEQAAGTSLAVVFLNALSGSIAYARQRRIDYPSGAWFAAATVPGAVLGAFAARALSGRAFAVIFGALLLAVAAVLFWRPLPAGDAAGGGGRPRGRALWAVARRLTDAEGAVFEYRHDRAWGLLLSFGVGYASSVLGVGGGIVHVPALVYWMGFPPHVATATSHFILVVTAGVGAASHAALGHVFLLPAGLMGLGAVLGAPLGARLSRRLHGRWIVRGLALALAGVGARLLAR